MSSSQSAWIEVGELSRAFARDSYALPETDALAGRELTLYRGEDGPVSYRFLASGLVRYTTGGETHEARARVTSIRPNVFLVDHPDGSAGSISLILDTASRRGLTVSARLPSRAEALRPLRELIEAGLPLTSVSAIVRGCSLEREGKGGVPPPERATDLIGAHNRYVYSAHEAYDHIYLSRDLYAWHCVRGVEAGLADVDRCETYRIADELYLFLWREKVIPTLGLLLIDLGQRRTDGKIMGYRDGRFTDTVSFPVGARIVPLTRLEGLGEASV